MDNLKHLSPPRMLRPFILTSDKRLPIFRQFIESYERIAHTLLEPVLIIDDSNHSTRQEYHDLLLRLSPIATISHPQLTADYQLPLRDLIPWILEFSQNDILFSLDTLCFSDNFSEGIEHSSQLIQTHTDIIVLEPIQHVSSGTDAEPLFTNFVRQEEGTKSAVQGCSVIRRRVIEDFYDTMHTPSTNIGWDEFCEKQKYKIYETTVPYVRSLVES